MKLTNNNVELLINTCRRVGIGDCMEGKCPLEKFCDNMHDLVSKLNLRLSCPRFWNGSDVIKLVNQNLKVKIGEEKIVDIEVLREELRLKIDLMGILKKQLEELLKNNEYEIVDDDEYIVYRFTNPNVDKIGVETMANLQITIREIEELEQRKAVKEIELLVKKYMEDDANVK